MKSKRQLKKRKLRKTRKQGGAWWNILKTKTADGEQQGINTNKLCADEIKDWNQNWKNEIDPQTGELVYLFKSNFTYPSLASKKLYGRKPTLASNVGISDKRICFLQQNETQPITPEFSRLRVNKYDKRNPGKTFKNNKMLNEIEENEFEENEEY